MPIISAGPIRKTTSPPIGLAVPRQNRPSQRYRKASGLRLSGHSPRCEIGLMMPCRPARGTPDAGQAQARWQVRLHGRSDEPSIRFDAHAGPCRACENSGMGQSMNYRRALGAAVVAAALLTTSMAAQAFDDSKYPDLSGQWVAVRLGVRGQPAFDPSKPWGLG